MIHGRSGVYWANKHLGIRRIQIKSGLIKCNHHIQPTQIKMSRALSSVVIAVILLSPGKVLKIIFQYFPHYKKKHNHVDSRDDPESSFPSKVLSPAIGGIFSKNISVKTLFLKMDWALVKRSEDKTC